MPPRSAARATSPATHARMPCPASTRDRGVDGVGGGQRDHADAAVERGLEVGARHVADAAHHVEDRLRGPGDAVEGGATSSTAAPARGWRPGRRRSRATSRGCRCGRRGRGRPWRRSGSARGAPRRGCGRSSSTCRSSGPAAPSVRAARGAPGSSRWSAGRWTPSRAPRRRGAPGRGRAACRPRRRRWSAPATSYSSGSSRPGCSAVSPPMSAQPATTQASAMPLTIAAIRSGTTRPVAM